jgi:hypothetical protein
LVGQGLGRQGEEGFGQGAILLAHLGIDMAGLPKDFIFMGSVECSLHDLANEGTARQTGLLRVPVNPGKEGSWQAERYFGNGHVHTSFIPIVASV